MLNYVAVALGGAAGASARFFLSGLAHDRFGASFPYGTLMVNIVGCFLIGLFMEMTETRHVISPQARLFFAVGVLGGFTTFSTYSFETLALARDGMMVRAALNAFGSVGLGLGGAWLGMIAGRML